MTTVPTSLAHEDAPRGHLDAMTEAEVAAMTRIAPSTLKDWRANRVHQRPHTEWGPRFYQLGRRVIYRRDWLDDWLKESSR